MTGVTIWPTEAQAINAAGPHGQAVQVGHHWRAIPYGATIPPAWQTNARATDPATSHQAAQRAAINAKSNRFLLLEAHVKAGSRGLQGDEIEAATGLAYETIGPRRPSLEADGLIRKATDSTGQPVTRNDKQVYVITPAGVDAWSRSNRSTAA